MIIPAVPQSDIAPAQQGSPVPPTERRYTCIRCQATESARCIQPGSNRCAECAGLLVQL